MLAAMVAHPGCMCATGKDLAVIDQRAAITRTVADRAASSELTLPQMAYALEDEARAAANLADAAHQRSPRFTGPPTNPPTELPWTPQGGEAK